MENSSNELREGLIIKSLAGLYDIEAGGSVFVCRARGLFRKTGQTPLVGDRVRFSIDGEEGVIQELLERRNTLLRPPVANVDRLVIVVSVSQPRPSTLLVDKITTIAVDRGIVPILVMNKADLGPTDELEDIYRLAGFVVYTVSCTTGEGIENLKQALGSGLSVFTGNSGVGKSSLLNRLWPALALDTGEVSLKLGRGRHTTRHVELFRTDQGGYVADTPGFSSLDVETAGGIPKENLAFAFPEFAPYLGKCRFSSCTHTGEKGCEVGAALAQGKIAVSRYDHYTVFYKEAPDRWEGKP